MGSLDTGRQSDIAPKIKGGGSEVVKSQIESQMNAIRKYTQQVNGIEEQITALNDARKENTGIVGGIGDWVGEKTGAYSTGKETYENQIKQIQDRAKALHAQIVHEFTGKTISESEQKSIEVIMQKLEKSSGAKLEDVSWGKAVFNTTNIDDVQGDAGTVKNRAKIGARAIIGLAEGGYEGVAGIMEITGKAIGLLGAYSFAPETRDIIEEDISKILSQLTLENAKKVLAMLPKALDEFNNLPPEKQAEGATKLIGMILVPLGIGSKVVKAGKSVGEAGMATVKAGAEMIKQGGARGIAAGMATVTLGTGELAIAGTAVAGGTAVRYVGEMGAGGKEKISQKAAQEAKMATAEARSGVTREMVIQNANLPDGERLSRASTLLGKELSPEQADMILHLHNDISKGVYQNGRKELRTMVNELDKVGFSRDEGRKLMENGILGSFDWKKLFGKNNPKYLAQKALEASYEAENAARTELYNALEILQGENMTNHRKALETVRHYTNPQNMYHKNWEFIDQLPREYQKDPIIYESLKRSFLSFDDLEGGRSLFSRDIIEIERLNPSLKNALYIFLKDPEVIQIIPHDAPIRELFLSGHEKTLLIEKKAAHEHLSANGRIGTVAYDSNIPLFDLSKVSPEMREDKYLVSRAVRENGVNWRHISESMKQDPYIIEQFKYSDGFKQLVQIYIDLDRPNADSEIFLSIIKQFTGKESDPILMTAIKASATSKKITTLNQKKRDVMLNAQLSDIDRIEVASEILGIDFTEAQKTAILNIHNNISKGVYQNGYKELRTMVKELDKAGFSRSEGRYLMSNGILGKVVEEIMEVKVYKKMDLLELALQHKKSGDHEAGKRILEEYIALGHVQDDYFRARWNGTTNYEGYLFDINGKETADLASSILSKPIEVKKLDDLYKGLSI